MPHQLERIRHLVHCDLFLAVDCLHEMRPERILHYFETADDMADGIYFKCWNKTKIPFDRIILERVSYPVLPEWRRIFMRDCIVPSDFFEAFYRMAERSPVRSPRPIGGSAPPTR